MLRIMTFVAASLIATAASAESDVILSGAAPARIVAYSDLDLHSADDRATMAGRIHFAADSLCTNFNVESLSVQLIEAKCYHQALTSGLQQMDAIANR